MSESLVYPRGYIVLELFDILVENYQEICRRSKIRAHGECLWLSAAKKDVISCVKVRGVAHTH